MRVCECVLADPITCCVIWHRCGGTAMVCMVIMVNMVWICNIMLEGGIIANFQRSAREYSHVNNLKLT